MGEVVLPLMLSDLAGIDNNPSYSIFQPSIQVGPPDIAPSKAFHHEIPGWPSCSSVTTSGLPSSMVNSPFQVRYRCSSTCELW